MIRCAQHGKLMFLSERAGRRALARARRAAMAGSDTPVRWYWDKACGSYHLTSKPAPVCPHCARDLHPGKDCREQE